MVVNFVEMWIWIMCIIQLCTRVSPTNKWTHSRSDTLMYGFCCLLVPHRVILNDEKSLVLGIYNRKYKLEITSMSTSREYLYWYNRSFGSSWKIRNGEKKLGLPEITTYSKTSNETARYWDSNIKILKRIEGPEVDPGKCEELICDGLLHNGADIIGYLFRIKQHIVCKVNLKWIKYLKVKRT